MRHARLTTFAVAVVAAVWMAMPQLAARQAAPGAPTGLSYVVGPGGSLQLLWTHATGLFTEYWIEAAGAPGAPAFLVLQTSAFAQPGNQLSKLPELLSSFSASGIGQGDYYVRIRGVNSGVPSGVSNEILLPVRTGCYAPGAPTNFGVIVRGTQGLLQWNPGNGGRPTSYIVRASFGPNDPNPPVQLGVVNTFFNLGIPPGSYYVHIVAVNACGMSLPSNEIVVTAPANTPETSPNPPPGQRLPQPYVRDLVFQFAQEARAAGYLDPQVACPPRPGNFTDPIEARKTQRNKYIDHIVSRLRQFDKRFGFNAKPTRAWVPAIIAGDEIAYHYGSDAPEGSPNVYLVDVLSGHCTGVSGDADRHTPDYRVFYDEFGRWTLAGLTP